MDKPTAIERGSVAAERKGRTVTLTITLGDDYAAIALYDECITTLRQGFLSLDLTRERIGQ